MTPLEIIAEWRKGCCLHTNGSCSEPGKPETCAECTAVMVEVLERKLKEVPQAIEAAFYLGQRYGRSYGTDPVEALKGRHYREQWGGSWLANGPRKPVHCTAMARRREQRLYNGFSEGG